MEEKPRRASLAAAGLGGVNGVNGKNGTNGTNGTNGNPDRRASIGNTFEGVPGHKRRESIPVASTRPPSVAPRLNKSASLRVQKDNAPPPSSFMCTFPLFSSSLYSKLTLICVLFS